MRLHVHQPANPSPSENGRTRIVVSDRDATSSSGEQGKNKGALSGGCSRLRVKVEIHPISNSNYFHIVLQLLFMKKSDGAATTQDNFGEENDGTTDTVELLFLAELRRSPKYGYESHQRSRSEGSPADTSPQLGDGAFVDLTVGSELFVINVFAEDKPRSQEDGMRQQESLGLCHRVVVKVSKQGPKEKEKKQGGKSKKTKKRPQQDASGNDSNVADGGSVSTGGGWLRHALRPLTPPRLRRAVTEDDSSRFSDLPDSISSVTFEVPPPTPSITEVCLQSWSVKTITSHHGMVTPEATTGGILEAHQRGSEATIIAHGMENIAVSRGVLLDF